MRKVCFLPFFFASCLYGQSAEAVCTSTLTITNGSVTAFGSTQLDYVSAAYYNLGATVVLRQGNDSSALNLVGQDNETASNRSLVSGTVSTGVIANQVYEVQTAHYLDVVYYYESGYDDVNGFSLLETEEAEAEMDRFAPNTEVFTGSEEIDFGDTYVDQDTHTGCNDERDTMINEYSKYRTGLLPNCGSFTQTAGSLLYPFSVLNYPSPSTAPARYSWAILRSALITPPCEQCTGIDAWTQNVNFSLQMDGARPINSGYRCPSQNASAGGARNSRHMFGDAADMKNVSRTESEWTTMKDGAMTAGADYVEPRDGPCMIGCVHADWRNH